MAQSVITKAFEKWNALNVLDGIASRPDKFVFALVPNQDANKPIDREEKLPSASQIKHTADITQYGLLNDNAVVYSCVLDTSIGDFDYNWIGLLDSKSNTVIMIVHVETQKKIKTQGGVQGNNLTRNFVMEFDGAAEATQINVTAETWQIDFSARLFGIDEMQRLANYDIYGDGAFFDKSFLVEKTGSQYFINAGLAYIGGLRSVLISNQNLSITTKPTNIYVDVCYVGTVTGRWNVQVKITVAQSLANYKDANSVQHYVFAVASIDAAGNIKDLRKTGSKDRQYSDATFSFKEHDHDDKYAAKDHNHDKQYFVQKNNLSEIKAAGTNAQKAARDNIGAISANDIPEVNLSGYVPTSRKVNGKPLNADVNLTAKDVGAASDSHRHSNYLEVPNNIVNVNLTASSSTSPFAGFGFFNEDIGFGIKYGTLIQSYMLNGGLFSIAQEATADMSGKVRIFARNGYVDKLGVAKLGEPVEFYHTANTHSHSLKDISDVGSAASKNVGVGAGQLPDMSAFATSKSGNGYQKLPSGMIIQWGAFSLLASNPTVSKNVNFPIAFPNACFSVVATPENANPTIADGLEIDNISNTGFGADTFTIRANEVLAYAGKIRFLAIGH